MAQQERRQLAGGAAENYERYLVPALFAPLAEDLVALAELQPGNRVLDVACGTGVVARRAARRLGGEGHVVGPLTAPRCAAMVGPVRRA